MASLGYVLTFNEVQFVSLTDNFTVQFSNLLKLQSAMKKKQLNGSGNYRELRETGHRLTTLQFAKFFVDRVSLLNILWKYILQAGKYQKHLFHLLPVTQNRIIGRGFYLITAFKISVFLRLAAVLAKLLRAEGSRERLHTLGNLITYPSKKNLVFIKETMLSFSLVLYDCPKVFPYFEN